jgi:hypothetical protein
MELERRSSFGWGATPAGYASLRNGLVVHYDGSNQGLAGKPHSACRGYWSRTRRFHVNTRGWLDIGYSFAVCPHGIVLEGRGLNRVQAAQPGGNSTWYSVTFMSGPSERPTDAQHEAFRELRSWLRGKGVAAAVKGHRDFISTSCPGNILYRMVRDGSLLKAPAPQPPAEETLKTVVDLGHSEPQTIAAGERRSLVFDVEWADPDKIHTDGAHPSIFPKGNDTAYSVTVEVVLEERPHPGAELTIARYERSEDVFDRDVRGAELIGSREVLHSNIRMSDNWKYRADLVNNTDKDVTVRRAYMLIAH